MKRLVLILFVVLGCTFTGAAQEYFKGAPADLPVAELLIVQYELDDIKIVDSRHPLFSYYQPFNELVLKRDQLNADLALSAAKNYPYQYRLIRKSQLAALKTTPGKSYYILEPAALYQMPPAWSTVALHLKDLKREEFYEVGFMLQKHVLSPDKTLMRFTELVPAENRQQALDPAHLRAK